MRRSSIIGLTIGMAMAGICVLGAPCAAQAPAESAANAPEVPAAKPGVFSLKKRNATRFHLAVAGHTFTSAMRSKYLAYRAAELT